MKVKRNVVEKGRNELEAGCNFYENGALYEARKMLEVAARLGNPEAQVTLANMFDTGEGFERNFKKAVYWYK